MDIQDFDEIANLVPTREPGQRYLSSALAQTIELNNGAPTRSAIYDSRLC